MLQQEEKVVWRLQQGVRVERDDTCKVQGEVVLPICPCFSTVFWRGCVCFGAFPAAAFSQKLDFFQLRYKSWPLKSSGFLVSCAVGTHLVHSALLLITFL